MSVLVDGGGEKKTLQREEGVLGHLFSCACKNPIALKIIEHLGMQKMFRKRDNKY